MQRRNRKRTGKAKRGGVKTSQNVNNGLVRAPRTSAMVQVLGENQPQSFPYTPSSRAIPKVFRFAVGRVSTNGAGDFLHRFSLRNLSRAFDGAGTYEDAVNLSNSFDMYKPIRLRAHFTPAFATSTFAVGSVFLAPDYDDLDVSQTVTTVAQANAYADRVILNPRESAEVVFRIPSIQSGSIPGVTSTSPAVIESGGFLDFNAPPYDGVVAIVGQGFPNNFAVYEISLEMDCLLKMAR